MMSDETEVGSAGERRLRDNQTERGILSVRESRQGIFQLLCLSMPKNSLESQKHRATDNFTVHWEWGMSSLSASP